MEIKIDSKELLMVDVFKKMRKIYKSKADEEKKDIAINEIWARANKMLDIEEGR